MKKCIEYDGRMGKLHKLFDEMKYDRDEYVKGNLTLEEFLIATSEKNAEIKKLVDGIRDAVNLFYKSTQEKS